MIFTATPLLSEKVREEIMKKDVLIVAPFTQLPGEEGNGRFHYIAQKLIRRQRMWNWLPPISRTPKSFIEIRLRKNWLGRAIK